jgi:nucleotide-binding universal stress UspA family protein
MEFKNILFPIDFSDYSIALKTEVEWMAKRFNSTVTLLHVFEIPPAWFGMGEDYTFNQFCVLEMLEKAKEKLNGFALDLPGNKIHRVTLQGQPATEIQQWCETHAVDVVAMATHGHGAMEGLIMGSVTAKVLQKVSTALWLSPVKSARTMGDTGLKIVCGIELGSEALPILLYAKAMAQAFQASVTLVHIVPEAETTRTEPQELDLYHLLKNLAQKELAADQKQAGTNFEVIISGHSITRALAKAANDEKADLVLIGRGQSQRFLGRFRTHTYDLLSQINCPVFSYCHEQMEAVSETAEPEAVSV